MESTSKEAKSDFTSGTNPHQTINQRDWIREGSPPPFLDNTTEQGNKRNETAFTLEATIKKETALEEKKDGTGKGEAPEMANADTTLLILLPGKGETPEMKKTEAPILVAAKNGITNMVEQILQKLPMAINDKSKEKAETTILLAARNGITEIVEYILNKFPLAIDDKSEGQNIVLLAAKNRQTHVLQLLLEQEFVKRKLIHEVDSDENNALHLAAQIGKQRPWLIPGAALQMQWEIKWYEV
nr:hypothetical protein CFP56_79336 [Quercus suber]